MTRYANFFSSQILYKRKRETRREESYQRMSKSRVYTRKLHPSPSLRRYYTLFSISSLFYATFRHLTIGLTQNARLLHSNICKDPGHRFHLVQITTLFTIRFGWQKPLQPVLLRVLDCTGPSHRPLLGYSYSSRLEPSTSVQPHRFLPASSR